VDASRVEKKKCMPCFGGIPYATVFLEFVSFIEMSDITRFHACG